MTVAEITKWAKEQGFSKTTGKRKAELVQYVCDEWSALPEEQRTYPDSKDPAYNKILKDIIKVERSLSRLQKLKTLKEERLAELIAQRDAF